MEPQWHNFYIRIYRGKSFKILNLFGGFCWTEIKRTLLYCTTIFVFDLLNLFGWELYQFAIIAQVSDVASVPLLLIPANTLYTVWHFSPNNVHTLFICKLYENCWLLTVSLSVKFNFASRKWVEWPYLHACKISRAYSEKHL